MGKELSRHIRIILRTLKSICIAALYIIGLYVSLTVSLLVYVASSVDRATYFAEYMITNNVEIYNDIVSKLTPIYETIFAIIVFIIVFIKRRKRKESYIKPVSKNKALILVSIGILFNLVGSIIVAIIRHFISDGIYEAGMNRVNSLGFISALIVTGIIMPIVEEFIFRYEIIKELEIKNIRFAIIISSMLFGIVHMNIIQGIYTSILGLLLSYVYIKKDRNLLKPIITHVAINVSSIISLYLPRTYSVVFTIIFSLLSIIIIGYSVYASKRAREINL